MLDFAKTIGQGLLYLLLSPFIIVGVLLYEVYSVFLFLFMFMKRVIMFFKGENMSASMRYDKAAEAHLQSQDEKENDNNNQGQTPIVQKETHVEKTTIVQGQPIIIQTDEEGRLKGVSYVQPAPQAFNNQTDVVEEELEEEDTSSDIPLINESIEDTSTNEDQSIGLEEVE